MGVCRPLDPEYACSGDDSCDHICNFLNRSRGERLLWKLWWSLVVGPLDYVQGGKIDEQRELHLVELSRLLMAQLYSRGLVVETVWLIAHANHHACLFEAAMFGSILDGGTLVGKLDREERS